jgi:hypothetical protein
MRCFGAAHTGWCGRNPTTSSSEGKTLIVKIAERDEILGTSALGSACEVSAETIEPAQVNLSAATPMSHPTATEPVTIRGTAYFRGPSGSFVRIFAENLSQMG